jgi:hypothetical protein
MGIQTICCTLNLSQGSLFSMQCTSSLAWCILQGRESLVNLKQNLYMNITGNLHLTPITYVRASEVAATQEPLHVAWLKLM